MQEGGATPTIVMAVLLGMEVQLDLVQTAVVELEGGELELEVLVDSGLVPPQEACLDTCLEEGIMGMEDKQDTTGDTGLDMEEVVVGEEGVDGGLQVGEVWRLQHHQLLDPELPLDLEEPGEDKLEF